MSPLPCAVRVCAQHLRDTGFLLVAGCQINPVVLHIRDDGPAILGLLAGPPAAVPSTLVHLEPEA